MAAHVLQSSNKFRNNYINVICCSEYEIINNFNKKKNPGLSSRIFSEHVLAGKQNASSIHE
ncbi:hypothetical protein DERP_012254 [Dermatophagoides pteronyssinus]|uniref:Uncharacterized protein n=1 Tax=Dermatophagoides pteronyssinus TaxID=6956 RepID=A0ABQ8JFX0_DERPT|nr:hypothetical protein DERP_012254 [Dermatophagoides pteronyssinus]